VLFFPYHGHYGGQLISGPVVLRRIVRLAPLHPHIMGDATCAWFGQKIVGRMVASMKGNPMMMIMMKISNKGQSNRCGGGTTKMMDYYYYYYK